MICSCDGFLFPSFHVPTIDFLVEDMPQTLTNSPVGWHIRLSNGALTGHGVEYTPSRNPRDGTINLTIWLNHETPVAMVGSAAIGKPISIDETTAIASGVWDKVTSLVSLPNRGFNIVTTEIVVKMLALRQ